MQTTSRTDEDLLSARDAASFELFYVHHVTALLGFLGGRSSAASCGSPPPGGKLMVLER